MKYFFLSAFVFVAALTAEAQLAPASVDEIMKEATLQASKEKKNVFIMFTASWCGWCKRMDKSMNDPVCKQFFDDNYVVRHIVIDESKDKKNLENPGASEFRTKYNGDNQGIPFWLVFDNEGKLLADAKMRKDDEGPDKGDNSGCPASEKEVAHFINVLKKTSALDAGQLEIIQKRFRENEK